MESGDRRPQPLPWRSFHLQCRRQGVVGGAAAWIAREDDDDAERKRELLAERDVWEAKMAQVDGFFKLAARNARHEEGDA